MTATLHVRRPILGRSYIGIYDQALTDAAGYGIGPRTRVQLRGHADEPAVRTALTAAWRAAGQPIVVVPPGLGPVQRVAADWAAEHVVAGIGLEVRHTVDAASAPVTAVELPGPVPGPAACPACGRVA